jgi:uncharacterized membrane protein YvlD (DUF360 family)
MTVRQAGFVLVRLAVVWLVDAVSLLFAAFVIAGFTITGDTFGQRLQVALAAALFLGIINLLIRPLLLKLSMPLGFIGVFVVGLVINAAFLQLVARVMPAVTIEGFGAGFWSAILVAGVNTILTSFIPITHKGSYYQSLIIKQARQNMFAGGKTDKPGLLMLEVDGLSYSHFQKAMKAGWLPYLKEIMEKQGYRLSPVECGIPSMTSSCQAGIMFGDNDGIPAFRWLDKEKGKMMVSHMDAAVINSWYAKGKGLLRGGTGVNNMLAGDALRSPLTMATLKNASKAEQKARARDVYFLMLHPYFFMRTLFLFFVDVGVELAEAFGQWAAKTEPRQNRLHNAYPLMRSAVTVICRDLQMALVGMDVLRGSPALYTTYAGYDEVAHHSGPATKDAYRTLKQFDAEVERLVEVAVKRAPRPYTLIILSDHGQSQGKTFEQRYGVTLKEFIEQKIPKGTQVAQTAGGDNGMVSVAAMGGELNNLQTQGTGGKVSQAMMKPAEQALKRGVEARDKDQAKEPLEITVCGSGNLAQVYFTFMKKRVSVEMLNKRYPGLLEALIKHAGVGLVIGYTEKGGSIGYGKQGTVYLENGKVNGKNPLKPYGEVELRRKQLERLASFKNNGDLTVVSTVYPDGSVAAMEELIGNHGGVGGEQTEAFMFHPKWVKMPATTNAEDVFGVLNRLRV